MVAFRAMAVRAFGIIRKVWTSLAAVATLVGILYLPADISDLPEALQFPASWWPLMSREELLGGYAIILTAWIVWSDIRPFARSLLLKLPGAARAPEYADDKEVMLIRSKIHRLLDYMVRLGPIRSEDSNIGQLIYYLDSSDHPVWLDKEIRQARADFLHHCNVRMALEPDGKRPFNSLSEHEEFARKIRELADNLGRKLTS